MPHTKQSYYDTLCCLSLEGLLFNRKRYRSNYLRTDGRIVPTMCAIGPLIDDEDYTPLLEGIIERLPEHIKLKLVPKGMRFNELVRIQTSHDFLTHEPNDISLGGVEPMHERIQNFFSGPSVIGIFSDVQPLEMRIQA